MCERERGEGATSIYTQNTIHNQRGKRNGIHSISWPSKYRFVHLAFKDVFAIDRLTLVTAVRVPLPVSLHFSYSFRSSIEL